jgi:hypothetical protein
MPDVDQLVIAVRNEYRSRDIKKSATRAGADYKAVCAEIAAIYGSEHWELPLKVATVLRH